METKRKGKGKVKEEVVLPQPTEQVESKRFILFRTNRTELEVKSIIDEMRGDLPYEFKKDFPISTIFIDVPLNHEMFNKFEEQSKTTIYK